MLYIFDRNENLITILKNDGNSCPYFEAVHTEKLTGENTFTFSVPADHSDCEYVQDGSFVAFKDLDNNWQMFEILREEDTHEESKIRTFYCEHVFYELLYDFIEDKRPYDVSAHFALTQALDGTRWSVGEVADLGINSTNFYRESVLSAVQKVAQTWGGELRFRVVVEGGQISGRYVDLLPRRGADTGKQFVYSKDIKSIKREEDLTPVITAAYGYGKGVEVGEGYSRRITFADVEWNTANGDPVDKPLGQTWVGDPEALQKWGRAGGTLHRFGVFDDSEEEDPAVLLQKTWEYLQQYKEPRITYELDVIDLERLTGYEHERVRLGDTVRIIDREFKPELLVEARVIEINRDLLKPEETKIVLGQFAPSIVDENMKLQETMQVVRDRQGIWDTGGFSGPVPTSWLDGIIDTLQNEVRAGNGSVTLTNDNGILIVDDPDNPTKALRLLGGLLAISNEKDPVTGEWVWRTFGTGDGFTADLLNAGQIRTDLVQIIGNSNFYWDGDYLYIVNPDNGNEQIRLSKEGIRFTKDGGQTWQVAMDFDGIRMEGKSEDGYTHYTGDGVKVYDENENLQVHLGTYDSPVIQNATFSRASVAYKSDGTQVAANVPRFEPGKFGQAVMVEEGTMNLISNSDVETDTTGWTTATYAGSGNFVNDNIGFGSSKSLKIQALADNSRLAWITPSFTLTENTTYTVSVYIKVSGLTAGNIVLATEPSHVNRGSVYLKFATIASGNTDWIRVTANITVAAGQGGSFKIRCWAENVNNGAQVWFDRIQVEQKPYATSFINGTRSAETLTIPTAGVLNDRGPWTIECWAKTNYAGGSHRMPFAAWNKFYVDLNPNDKPQFSWVDANGAQQSVYAANALTDPTGWHYWVFTWDGSVVRVYVDGVKVIEVATDLPKPLPSNLTVGSISNNYYWNGLIDDLRISSRARTDEEILAAYQSGQPLPVDEWTTWKNSFDNNLQSVIYVKNKGLYLKRGTLQFNTPAVDEGIRVYDAQGNLRTHIGQYAEGKYGIKIIDGRIYSSSIMTGDENSANYIKLSPGDSPLEVVRNNKIVLDIYHYENGGVISFSNRSGTQIGQIGTLSDGLFIEAAPGQVQIYGQPIYLYGTVSFSGSSTGYISSNINPNSDDVYSLGNSVRRWNRVYTHYLTQGDLCFTEVACAICERPFESGDILCLLAHHIEGETMTIPVHLACKDIQKTITLQVPARREKYRFLGNGEIERYYEDIFTEVEELVYELKEGYKFDEDTGNFTKEETGEIVTKEEATRARTIATEKPLYKEITVTLNREE